MRMFRALRGGFVCGGLVAACLAASAAYAQQNTLFPPIPIPPDQIPDPTVSTFVPYVMYQYTYDNDVFRLPTARQYPQVVNLLPPGASVADHFNTGTAGFDGHWVVSQQSVDYDFEVDENHYVRNTDLDNTSGLAKALWNWSVASDFYGQLGGSFSRSLTGFTESFSFQRDMINRQEYFANGRYQVGPHWAVYGGVDETYTKNSLVQDQFNDLSYSTGKVGVEYATSQQNTFGAQYSYAHGHYLNLTYACLNGALQLGPTGVGTCTDNGTLYNPDYNENTLSLLFKYLLSDKTNVSGDAGYLRRDYPNNVGNTASIGAFSGAVWHLKGFWQPTDKTSLQVTAGRDLQAYLFAASDYFVQTGASVSPVWQQTDKIAWVLVASWYQQNYIGSSASVAAFGPRHDTISAQQGGLQYTPIRALVFTFTYRHEERNSTQTGSSAFPGRFEYNDSIANAGVKFKF